MFNLRAWKQCMLLATIACALPVLLRAQTESDGDMMAKGLLCTGPMYSYSSWNHYWEGTLKRNNPNLGTISTRTLSLMGNYGISKKLNVLFSVPYVQTHASAGTLHGMNGIQDLSLFFKWRPVKTKIGSGSFSLIGVAGYSTPLSGYTPDFLPMSIGLHSRNLTGRVLADYQFRKVFASIAGAYTWRSNVMVDRNAYYTTEMHYSNEVEMPDAFSTHLRAGYRSKNLLAEAVFTHWNTLGGFDITRNNMPFPSNRMNWLMGGVNIRWIPKPTPSLTLNAGADYTLSGRNTGQASTVYGGVTYIFHFNRKKTRFQFQTN